MFDSRLIDHVVHLWEGGPGESRGLGLDREMVKDVMETVFLAGLKREEERPIQISVSLIDPHRMEEWQREGVGSVVMQLSEHLPFSTDSLVKLALAFDHMTTSVAVWPVTEGVTPSSRVSRLEIWGGVFTSLRGRNRFDALVKHLPAPEALTISSRKAGSLTILRGSTIIARFNAGRISQPTPTPFTSSLMSWSLLKEIKTHPGFKTHGTKYWRVYRDLIDRLLVESFRRGHGGTIVWLPPSAQEMVRHTTLIQHRHRVEDGPEGVTLVEQLCALDRPLEEGREDVVSADLLEAKRRLVEYVEFIAQLTRVDGALVISDRLLPLSFGALLNAPPWHGHAIYGPKGEVIYGRQREPGDRVDLSRFGARHNSAVNFVGQSESAVAFVLSQDGPVAGLTQKDGHTIYWWPDCLSNLWSA